MAFVYSKDDEHLLIQCKQCKGIIEFPCDKELREKISSEDFRFEVISDLDDVHRHAIVLNICDTCFKGLNEKKETKE